MRRLVLAVAAGAALALAQPATAAMPDNAPGQYAPRDACSADPALAAFLAEVRGAAARRDASALAALAAPDVLLDFGGGAGRDELKSRLGLAGGELWRELGAVLELGCALQDGYATMPWFFAQDLGDADPFEVLLAVGEAVPLRTKPEAGAGVSARLSWQLVTVEGEYDPDRPFVPVRLLDGSASGYAERTHLRSPVDYRLIAEQQEGRWTITAFVAGD